MTGVSRVRLRTVTGFKRMGKWVFRLAKNHVKVTREKHPEMARTNEDFGSSRKFFARLNNAMGDLLAWRIAAAKYGGGMTGDNFMFHVNYDKLEGGAVACFRLFRFSVGTLWLPWNLAVTREKGTVTITWRDNRHSAHFRLNSLWEGVSKGILSSKNSSVCFAATSSMNRGGAGETSRRQVVF